MLTISACRPLRGYPAALPVLLSVAIILASTACWHASLAKPPRLASLPYFRATQVRVQGDTAWFLTEEIPEHATRFAAVAFVVKSGTWLLTNLTWRQMTSHLYPLGRSGTIDPGMVGSRPLPGGNAVSDDNPGVVDPRHVGQDDAEDHELPQLELDRPGAAPVMLGVGLDDSARTALYAAAGGTRDTVPPFNTMPSYWAASGDTLAFAFPAVPPPEPEAPWIPLSEDELSYDPLLSGLVVFVGPGARPQPVADRRFIEHGWAGIEIASGALWVVPALVTDTDVDYADAPSRQVPPSLARYDLTARTWRVFKPDDVPLAEPIESMAGDGTRLFVASWDGLAVFDTRTLRWTARFYADSTYRLADGADTSVTLLAAARPAPAWDSAGAAADALTRAARAFTPGESSDAADSASVALAFAMELPVRHRSAFARDLLRLVPYDSLVAVNLITDAAVGSRWNNSDYFGSDDNAETALGILSDTAFRPYLREAMFSWSAQQFLLSGLGDEGRALLRSAAPAILDSGSLPAALAVAESLMAWNDPAGLAWVRREATDARPLLERRSSPDSPLPSELERLLANRVRTTGDSVAFTDLLALVDTTVSLLYPEEYQGLLDPLFALRGRGLESRVAHAVEQRPLLWESYLGYLFFEDTSPLGRDDVRATASRIAASLLALGDSLAMESFVPRYPAERWQRPAEEIAHRVRVNRANHVLNLSTRLDARTILPALVASLGTDTTATQARLTYLVLLTANDSGPPPPRDPAEHAAVARYWSDWWTTHEQGFVPVSAAVAEAAKARWTATWYRPR